jgi:ABC-type glycerol-3-phosphate transport system substrate-binding protein
MKTIYDIAKSLKLNPSTVSRALRGDARVSVKTRERVKDYAEEVGYTPNVSARNLASGQTHCFWLLTPGLFGGQEQEVCHCISDYFSQHGYDLMILTYQENPETFKRMVARLKQNVADGAFIIGPHNEKDFAESFALLETEPLPIMYLMRGPEDTKITRFYLDEAAATRQLLNEILAAGATAIILGFENDNSSNRMRRDTIEFELRKRKIKIYRPRDFEDSDFSKMKNTHVAYLGSNSSEITDFNEKYFARFPESCRLSVGIFDEWKGGEEHFYNIFVCQSNLNKITNDASATMLRLQEDAGNLKISRLSRSISHRINYIKYHPTQKRSNNMSMRWNIAIVAIILAIMSGLATLWQPDLDLQGRKPLVWTTDPNPQRDDQVTTFNKMYPKYKLRIDPDNTGSQKVITQCSANMGPDVIDAVTNSSYQLYHSAGVLKDLTEDAVKMGFGPDTLPPSVRSLVMLKVLGKDGRIKERQFIYPSNVYHVFFIINKNVFKKNGVSIPKGDVTWGQILKIAKKLTIYENKGDSIPKSFGLNGIGLLELIWQKGGALINKEGTRSLLDSEAALNAAVFLHDLYYKYKVMPSPTQRAGMASQGGWGSGNFNYLADGRVAMMPTARYSLIQFRRLLRDQRKARDKFLKANPNRKNEAPEVARLGACLMPRFKGKKRYTGFGARCTGVNVAASNPQGALDFMQYLASRKYADLINQGADSKPGPAKYCTLAMMKNPVYQGEEDVDKMTIASVPFGRAIPRSPFISVMKIRRILQKVSDKIIAKKDLTREEMATALKRAAMQTDEVIARNIKRNPHLYKFYNKLLEQGAQPIKINLDEVSK